MPDKPPVAITNSHKIKPPDVMRQMPAEHEDQSSNNAASNGYWIHDDIGPKHYVAPPDANGVDIDEGDLVSRIVTTLQSKAGPGSSRMHVALDKGVVILKGIAVSEMESQLVGRAVQTVAGDMRVVNQLVIDEAFQNYRPLS